MDDIANQRSQTEQDNIRVELETRGASNLQANVLTGVLAVQAGPMEKDPLLAKAQTQKRESKYLDFKKTFDPGEKSDWCEIIKDIVAMANSGGGVIVIGVEDNGQLSDCDISPILAIDMADFTNKIYKYTGVHFADLFVSDLPRHGQQVCVIRVLRSDYPITFTSPGTYVVASHKKQNQKTAFGVGTTYFRHGAKSEPADHEDLRKFVDRKVEQLRKQWTDNIHKVVKAPADSTIKVIEGGAHESNSSLALPVRVVDDPNAPAVRRADPDETHPYRQKDLIAQINKLLAGAKVINRYDVQCFRRTHDIDSQDEYSYQSRFGSRQYSQRLVESIVEQFGMNPSLFDEARAADKKIRKERLKLHM